MKSVHVWIKTLFRASAFRSTLNACALHQTCAGIKRVRHWRLLYRLPKDELLVFQLHAQQPVQKAWELELDVGIHAHDSAATEMQHTSKLS